MSARNFSNVAVENYVNNLTDKTIEINDQRDNRCSAHLSYDNISCIELDSLIEMAKAYNKDNNNKIHLHDNFETLNPAKYKIYLVKQFNDKLKNVCTSQHCWTTQDFINRVNNSTKMKIRKYTFRPEGPEGKHEWLGTYNIDEVMAQYSLKHRDFYFLGAVPIDAEELSDYKLKNINFNEYIKKDITKFGIIFNLDEHYKSGSHWVSLYFDLKKGQIYFFDSYGIEPEERIRSFMRKVYNFITRNMGIKNVDARHNKMRHQYGNSECGMYSLYFIIGLAEGKDISEFYKNKITDDMVNKFRNVYFRNTKHKFK